MIIKTTTQCVVYVCMYIYLFYRNHSIFYCLGRKAEARAGLTCSSQKNRKIEKSEESKIDLSLCQVTKENQESVSVSE